MFVGRRAKARRRQAVLRDKVTVAASPAAAHRVHFDPNARDGCGTGASKTGVRADSVVSAWGRGTLGMGREEQEWGERGRRKGRWGTKRRQR
ncbi:hypothetical protein MTO96_040512 [Rhipicephalus appendiculatus]